MIYVGETVQDERRVHHFEVTGSGESLAAAAGDREVTVALYLTQQGWFSRLDAAVDKPHVRLEVFASEFNQPVRIVPPTTSRPFPKD